MGKAFLSEIIGSKVLISFASAQIHIDIPARRAYNLPYPIEKEVGGMTTPIILTPLEIFLRLLCAMAVGMVIGTEREYSNRPAGMRTHILVALGASAVMVISQQIFAQYNAFGAYPDPARLPAQVITGVGFLGAGTIMREGSNVKGLTTAASLWAVACLGVAAGGGYYAVAIIGAGFIFVTLTVMEVLQSHLVGPEAGMRRCWVETEDIHECLNAIHRQSLRCNAAIRDITTEHLYEQTCRVTFHFDIGGLHSRQRRHRFLEGLTSEKSIRCVHIFTNEQDEKRQA